MKTLEVAISLFASFFSVLLYEKVDKIYDNFWISVSVACLLSCLLYLLLNFLFFSLPMNFLALRRILYKIHRIEGYWFEIVLESKEHPYSFAIIEYDPQSKAFNYYGRNYKNNFEINAFWDTTSMVPKDERRHIQFIFEAVVESESKKTKMSGFGYLKFYSDLGWDYLRGAGEFVDIAEFSKSYTLELIRMKPQSITKILGKCRIETPADVKKLVEYYAREYNLPPA